MSVETHKLCFCVFIYASHLEVCFIPIFIWNKVKVAVTQKELQNLYMLVNLKHKHFQISCFLHRWEDFSYNYNNERPTGQKHTYNRWDDGGK